MFLQVCVILFTGGEYRHPPDQVHPPGPGTPPLPPQSLLRDTVNTRAVRILLECNLVLCPFTLSEIDFFSLSFAAAQCEH